MSKTPLSWSRISSYRQCPKQFKAKYIAKDYPDEGDNPAFAKGTKVHKQLEDYINWKNDPVGKAPILGVIANNGKKILDKYLDALPKGSVNAEKQLAIDHNWETCDWFANADTVKFRGILDCVIFIGGETVTIIDFKTGKVRPYNESLGQLHLSSAMIFELFPLVKVINNAYMFLEHKESHKSKFLRDDHAKTKASFDREWLEINDDTTFKAKKNKYCNWCLIKADCEFG